MKKQLNLFNLLIFSLLTVHAAVPLAWEVRPGQPAPATFDRYHGETLAFTVTFKGFGELPSAAGADVRLWYQTNGMGTAWWSAPAVAASNVITATWSPELDPGAERVSLFFGAPSNAYAAAVLRLRHSPGFTPANPPPPAAFSEADPVFSAWLAGYVPPNTSLEPATNYTDRATNEVWRASTNYAEQVAGEFADGTRTAQYATDSYSAYEADHLSDDDGNIHSYSEIMGDATNAAEAVAGPMRSDIEGLRTESALVYRLYSGSNVVAEVTNYNSQVHAPELRLMQLNESNEYVTVWTEANGLARTLGRANEYTDAAITNRAAPRAWSGTTSGLGAEAPPNTTWISTPRTVIGGGLEYAKIVDAYGEVWVLTSNGMTPEFSPSTNAYFRISSDDGTEIFSIEKSNALTVGADADDITAGESIVVIPVGVVSAEHPTMYWRQNINSGDWADESTPPSGATVTWTGGTGAWVCTVSFGGTRPSLMFFKFTFLQPGGVVIRNNATTDLSQGIIVNGTTYVPVVNGSTLTWQAAQ